LEDAKTVQARPLNDCGLDNLGGVWTQNLYVFDSDKRTPYGCTNPLAYNYDKFATKDDGKCIKRIYGCVDDTAVNFMVDANTDDGTCVRVRE